MRFFSECGSFLRETRKHFFSTGAVLPSSRFLAKALVAELRQPRPPSRILEVGPGTGSVTKMILRQLLPSDRLDAVEINARFAALLQRRFETEWEFHQHLDQVEIIQAAVEDLLGDGVYDFIVSGLPFNNFPVAQV